MQSKSFSEASVDSKWFLGQGPKGSDSLVKDADDLLSRGDNLQQKYGEIHLICGPMFSGKTTQLLKIIQQVTQPPKPKKCLVISHENDNRYFSDGISTHDGQTLKATKCKSLKEIAPLCHEHDVIVIDEAQFFLEIVEFCEKIANEGKIVYLAACDGTFQRKPFGRVHELIPLAETVTKLAAKCSYCKNPASYTVRIAESDEIVLTGGEKEYQAACRKCHIEQSLKREMAKKTQEKIVSSSGECVIHSKLKML